MEDVLGRTVSLGDYIAYPTRDSINVGKVIAMKLKEVRSNRWDHDLSRSISEVREISVPKIRVLSGGNGVVTLQKSSHIVKLEAYSNGN